MLARMREPAARRENFAFETTLASRSLVRWLAQLQRDGYDVHLLFLWLRGSELAVNRVMDACVRAVMTSPRKSSGGVIALAWQICLSCTFRWRTAGRCSMIRARPS